MWILTLVLVLAAQPPARPVAQSKEVLLEQAIYKEETAGDIEAAIGLYRQIVAAADAERAVTAQALYRLGLCLERRGRKEEARGAFDRLVREFGDQADLAARVRARLAPALLPAPWVDGEAAVYASRTSDNQPSAAQHVQLARKGPGGTWILRRYYQYPMSRSLSASATLTEVEVDADTSAPLRSVVRGYSELSIRYSAGRAEVTNRGVAATVDLKSPAFDRHHFPALLRRLPLTEGFSTSLPLFSSTGGLTDARIAVAGRESVTVPAGTFDCYKVVMTTGPVHTNEETLWVSTDARRHIVKEGRSSARELSRVETWDVHAPRTFDEERWGVSLTAPPGWLFARAVPREAETSFAAGVLSADGEITCGVDFEAEGGYRWSRDRSPREVGEAALKSKASGQSTLAVRPDGWTDEPVAGLPAARYVAEYRDVSERDMVDYSAFIRSQAVAAEFSCRVTKALFASRRAEIDALLESLRVP